MNKVRRRRRAVRWAQQGQYTRELQSLTSGGLARPNKNTTKIMKSRYSKTSGQTKHPHRCHSARQQ